MGVVSNGMLCSGDELGLTADADGILILPADTPLGRPLAELFGDIVLDVDVKPNRGDALSIVGLAREVAAVTGAPLRFPPTDVVESGRPTAERLRSRSSTPTSARASSVAGSSGVHVGPSPDRGPDAPAGRRPAPDQQRRRRLELRDARARQADPHVRCGRRPRRPDHRPPRARPGSGSRRSTTSTRELDPETLVIADPAGPIGIAGVMGGAASEVGDAHDRRHRRVGDLRPGQHPPDGLPLRAAVRGEPALREGPGVAPGAHRRRPDGPADRASGPAARSRPARSTPTRSSRAPARVAFRPARVNRLLGTDLDADGAARAAGAGRDRDGAGRGRDAGSGSPPGREPLDVDAGAATRSSTRPSRPGAATSRSRPTSPRRSSASAATTASRPTPAATRRCRRSATIRWRVRERGPRDARRGRPDRGRDLRARRTAARSSGSRRTTTARSTASPSSAPAGRPIVVTNPLSSQHSVLRQSLVGSLLEVVSTNLRVGPRRRRDLRGRQGLRRDRRRHRRTSGGVSASRLTGAALAAAPGTGRRARSTSTTRRASSSSSAGRLGFPAPGLHAARPTTRTSTPAGRRASTAGGRLVGRVGELHPERRRGARPARRADLRRRARGRGPRRRASRPPSRVTAPSRHPVRRARPGRHRGRRAARPPSVEAAIRRHGGPLLRGVDAVRHLPRPPLADDRQEPGLPADPARRRADADRRRARRRRRGRRRPA